MIRVVLLAGLWATVAAAAVVDYTDIASMTGPCVRHLTDNMKTVGLKGTRDKAQLLCQTDAGKDCPDLWLVYAFCETGLEGPEAVKAGKEAVKRLPDSAGANLVYAMALLQDCSKGGILRMLRQIGLVKDALERVIQLDPDCHTARSMLVTFYSMPGLIGGDSTKCQLHLGELDRRHPYQAALAHGEVEYMKGNYQFAAEFFRKAQQISPEEDTPIRRLIENHASLGEFEEAFRLCSELKSKTPDDSGSDGLLVKLSAMSGLHTDEALIASDRFLAGKKFNAPLDRADILINTAIILRQLGRHQESADRLADADKESAGFSKVIKSREKSFQKARAAFVKK